MANEEHLAVLRQGSATWNKWWGKNPNTSPDLTGATLFRVDLTEADLSKANLTEAAFFVVNLTGARLFGANLTGANLFGAILFGADLSGVNLSGARLFEANLSGANLTGANLSGVDLFKVDLTRVNLSGANLTGARLFGANLARTILVETDLTHADLSGCHVYGMSAWDLKLEGAQQRNLVITQDDQPEITVDNLEVAQFIYLLLHNEKIRHIIDTIGKKGVLLLGRFTGGRIAILEKLREELRKRNFIPMVFNFDKPETKDFTETVRVLAGLSHFIIADITNPRSTPLELQAVVPVYMIPFVPILEKGEEPFAMFKDLWIKHREWVLNPIRYSSVDRLIEVLDTDIVKPAEVRFNELLMRRTEELQIKDI